MTFLLFFVLPVTLKPKYVAIALLVVELLGFVFYEVMRAASPFGSGIGISAHLGGMLAGWIYFRYIHEASWRLPKSSSDIELPRWLRKRPKAVAPPPVQIDITRREDLRAEVDRILDKINSDGFGALTVGRKAVAGRRARPAESTLIAATLRRTAAPSWRIQPTWYLITA